MLSFRAFFVFIFSPNENRCEWGAFPYLHGKPHRSPDDNSMRQITSAFSRRHPGRRHMHMLMNVHVHARAKGSL